jgi:hypothetical protein
MIVHYTMELVNATGQSLWTKGSIIISIDSLKIQATKIFQSLRNLNTNINMTLGQFLESLEMSKDTYMLSLRSQLTKSHIFLKRKPIDIKTNAFKIRVAPLWFANTHAQFVLDVYAAATYCTSFRTKNDKPITKKK